MLVIYSRHSYTLIIGGIAASRISYSHQDDSKVNPKPNIHHNQALFQGTEADDGSLLIPGQSLIRPPLYDYRYDGSELGTDF